MGKLKSVAAMSALVLAGMSTAQADEGGISFWLPGTFGSLAAVPQQPGWSSALTYYHTSVSAGGEVSRAREHSIGNIPVNVTANVNATIKADVDLGLFSTSYVFQSPVLGGQASVGLTGIYGRNSTSLAGTLTGSLALPGGGVIPFGPRSDNILSVAEGFGDLYPQFALRWNAGVHNYMTYVTGDIPVGTYSPTRLANIGIGHGAIDAGGGYTYFNPQSGHEFSAVVGMTYNFRNPDTQYQNGIDLHFDWAASQFLSKQTFFGLVGYVYKQVGCDSGTGDRVGCFRSQVAAIGPQLGFIFPVGAMQGFLNIKGYKEFAAENRPEGWNAWVTFAISQNPPPSAAPPRPTSK